MPLSFFWFNNDVSKAELLQLKLIHLFARDILLLKRSEIGKTKPTYIISDLKVEYRVVLVSSISNFFSNKMSLANKWTREKILFSFILNFVFELVQKVLLLLNYDFSVLKFCFWTLLKEVS